MTLKDVLKEAGLTKFEPKGGEHEKKLLERVRKIVLTTRRFVACVRISDGILRPSMVLGPNKGINSHNIIESQLARARTTFQCFAQNQSRHAMWQGFSERVLEDINEGREDDSKTGARAVQNLGSTCSLDRQRSYQFLVVRLFCAGEGSSGLRIALPVSVWRVGRNKQHAGTPKLYPEGKVPIHMVSKVHVLLLNSFVDESTESFYVVGSLLWFLLEWVSSVFEVFRPLLQIVSLFLGRFCI